MKYVVQLLVSFLMSTSLGAIGDDFLSEADIAERAKKRTYPGGDDEEPLKVLPKLEPIFSGFNVSSLNDQVIKSETEDSNQE